MPTSKKQGNTNTGKGAIAPAKGKLGIMIPGMGAVATTFVAGVEAVRKGISSPIGSLTQMGTIRLGKRTEGRFPKINEFVPLAGLNDLVFTGWDIFEDNMYSAARNAGVLEVSLLDQVKPFLSKIKPRKAVFDKNYVKRIDGPNVKKGKNKMELAEQLRDDIRDFKKSSGADRLVMIWCASTETFMTRPVLPWPPSGVGGATKGGDCIPQTPRLLIRPMAGAATAIACGFGNGIATSGRSDGLGVTVCHFPPGTSKWNKSNTACSRRLRRMGGAARWRAIRSLSI